MRKVLALFLLVGSTIIFAEEGRDRKRWNFYGKAGAEIQSEYTKQNYSTSTGSQIISGEATNGIGFAFTFDATYDVLGEGGFEFGAGTGYLIGAEQKEYTYDNQKIQMPSYNTVPLYLILKYRFFDKGYSWTPYLEINYGLAFHQLQNNDQPSDLVTKIDNYRYQKLALGVELFQNYIIEIAHTTRGAAIYDVTNTPFAYNYETTTLSFGYKFSY
ncbi:MAG: hypothetical protein ACRC0V_06680 [Fusobacteriaceae bacterium]